MRWCSIAARTMPAVASGRSARSSFERRSSKLYISFSTMSVASPMPRTNSGVCSTIGTRRLRYPYWAKVSRAASSSFSQSAASSGSTSFMPRTAWIVAATVLDDRLDIDRFPRAFRQLARLAAVPAAHVGRDDLLEFLGDTVALEGDGL